jgi:hypothetical protein
MDFTYFVGFALSWANLGHSYTNPSESFAVDLAGAYVARPGVAFGLHVRGAHIEGWTGDRGGYHSKDTLHSFYTCDVAATGHFSTGRLLVAPWAGAHLAHGTHRLQYGGYYPDPTPPAEVSDAGPLMGFSFGVMLSIDVAQFGGNAIAVYGEAQGTLSPEITDTYAYTVGVAYRR